MNEINLLNRNSSKLKDVFQQLQRKYNVYKSATHSYKTSLSERITIHPTTTLFIPFSINKHAMLLIVDPDNSDVELFDPMGRTDIPQQVKNFVRRNFPKYTLLHPNVFFPSFSFQKYEELLQTTPQKGNCSWWVAWYILYRASNSTIDRKKLADDAIQRIFKVGPHLYMNEFKLKVSSL